jgi:hypothetical protein
MHSSGATRREIVEPYSKWCNVIARSPCDEAIHLSFRVKMDCFASLAMTASRARAAFGQNGLLRNFDPFNP